MAAGGTGNWEGGCGLAVRDRDGLRAHHVLLKDNRVHDAVHGAVCLRKSTDVAVLRTRVSRRVGTESVCIEAYKMSTIVERDNVCDFYEETSDKCGGLYHETHRVCCPKECGVCGGVGCGTRLPKGKCCVSDIKKSDRKCSEQEPPCLM